MGHPLLAGDRFVFESGGAVHVTDARGRPLKVIDGVSTPHWIDPGRALGVVRAGAIEIVQVAR